MGRNEMINYKDKPILLVEDDKIDVLTVERVLKEIKVTNPLQVAYDGLDALQYLYDEEKTKPCIILLDLNMPRISGLELLERIKQDEKLKSIPVIILTTSTNEEDKERSFNNGIAGYIIKPLDFQEFFTILKTIDLFWTLNELPN